MRTADFDFTLPPELIAQVPLERRDDSKLLVLDRARHAWSDRCFNQLPEFLNPGDLLVFNDTQVVPARLRAKRVTTGGGVEVFLLPPDPELTAASNDKITLRKALTRSGGRLHVDETLILQHAQDAHHTIRIHLKERLGAAGDILEFECSSLDLDAWCREHGEVPLPPYIKREAGPSLALDRERYQTIFAREPGAVAAPTAGLHFTPEMLQRLSSAGVETARITLHVGPGTFKTVKAEELKDHIVDPEPFHISKESSEAITKARREGRRIVAVGTTVLRTLESQWNSERNELNSGAGWADIFIHPPHRFHVARGLLTNFHLPKSSLLMLAAAFANPEKLDGMDWLREAYRHAVETKYRFFSYGDACLFI